LYFFGGGEGSTRVDLLVDSARAICFFEDLGRVFIEGFIPRVEEHAARREPPDRACAPPETHLVLEGEECKQRVHRADELQKMGLVRYGEDGSTGESSQKHRRCEKRIRGCIGKRGVAGGVTNGEYGFIRYDGTVQGNRHRRVGGVKQKESAHI